MRPAFFLTAFLVMCLAVRVFDARAATEEFRIIVHPDNPVTEVGAELLRSAYLKRSGAWPGGATVRPLDLGSRGGVRASFAQRVLRKTPAQLRSYWNQRIFSGKGTPPPQVDTAAEAIAFVLSQPGGVAYIPVGVDPGGAKIIELR
ncbi:MAG TPA: hypothetical protein VM261_06265 [Kofleriaceae bacterium]|nr:hypothetical protein [Kofleriaceae bacterium]